MVVQIERRGAVPALPPIGPESSPRVLEIGCGARQLFDSNCATRLHACRCVTLVPFQLRPRVRTLRLLVCPLPEQLIPG
jgi:hypothetical protein